MGVSKVVLGDETLIDLTSDSVSSENLLQGATAHGPDGEEVIGGVVVTNSYEELNNKPLINGIELNGDKKIEELGIASAEDLSAANKNINVNSEKISEVETKVDTIIEKAELNIKNSASGENIHLTDSANSKVVEFGLYGKATQDGEPTPDNPIEITVSGSDGSVEVKSVGKNLLPYPYSKGTFTQNGVIFTDNGDGSLTMNGTATANIFYYLIGDGTKESGFKLGGKYIVSTKNYISNVSYLRVGISGSAYYDCTSEKEVKFPINSDIYVMVRIGSGEVLNNVTIYPMIRLATDTDNTWQPYKETLSTILTENGLAGIKVSSNGNYTDQNGQQWICDEVVKYADGSGAYIQRVKPFTLNGSESWSVNTTYNLFWTNSVMQDAKMSVNPVICDSYVFDASAISNMADKTIKQGIDITGTKIYLYIRDTSFSTTNELQTALTEKNISGCYILANPITTPLTAEELAEIEKLYTFYPVTNISNDAECGMSITYMADAKNYIDNRLALIESAMLNNI